jgi:hypothetical protein
MAAMLKMKPCSNVPHRPVTGIMQIVITPVASPVARLDRYCEGLMCCKQLGQVKGENLTLRLEYVRKVGRSLLTYYNIMAM